MTLNLKQLFEKQNVKGLSNNSKNIKSDDAFFALKGKNFNGNDFIKDALNKGASLIITDDKTSIDIALNKIIYTFDTSKVGSQISGEPAQRRKLREHRRIPKFDLPNLEVSKVYIENAQAALYEAIEIFYPNTPQTMIAVTGTNGKTSVVSYIAQLYSLLGKKAASIGTIGVEIFGSNNLLNDAVPELTTPDYLSLRKIAHNLVKENIECLAFEASSHGLDQERLGNIKVNIACFTSFSQDHLDYHHTKENYLMTKLKLFTDNLLPNGLAILNSDIPEIEFIKGYLDKHKIKYLTVGANGDLKITKINSSLKGQNINFTFNNKEYNFNTAIIGSFQASNLLIAALSLHHTGFAIEQITNALPKIKPVKGRMEGIDDTNIFVDYAHTPDALEKSLTELKNIKVPGGKLNVIFGCGGNRDTTKRRFMGQIAAKLADNIIITDDNPRSENPQLIRKEIISGIGKANYTEIADREEAIKYGINNLKQDDILLIAGKGHENYQIIGDRKIPFDDAKTVKKYT